MTFRPARIVWLALLVLVGAGKPSALDGLAGELADRAPADVTVAVAVHARDAQTARLADVLAGLLVGRLPRSARVDSAPAARRAGFARLLDVEVATDGPEVVALGRVVVTQRDLWAEAAGHGAAGLATAFAVRARADAELRAYLAPSASPPVAPTTRPARPRKLAFRALKGGLDLGAPLLALTAADLDGDGRAELIALSADEVAILHLAGDGARIDARAPLEGPALLPHPRLPVGALAVSGDAVRARSSEHAQGGTFTFAAGTFTRAVPPKGFPICTDASAQLVPGQHLYGREGFEAAASFALPARFLDARCAGGLLAAVEPSGALRLLRAGERAPWATITGVGAAFALADVDGDGELEAVTSAYRAPGTGDVFTIYRLLADGSTRTLRRGTLLPGGIVAIAAGDLDGDGVPEVVGATRVPGTTRNDLWVLE